MQFNRNLFRAKLAENGLNNKLISEKIGISVSTLQRKISNNGNFSLDEMHAIAKVLNLSKADICDIFFNKEVA